MPCIQYAFGLFIDESLVGCVTFGQPASPSLCKGIAGEANRKYVLELNRLVLLPEYNGGNYASFLIGHALKMLPNRTFVVSYADTAWTQDIYIKQLIFCIRDVQNRELTNILKAVIQGIICPMKQEDNPVAQNIDMYIL